MINIFVQKDSLTLQTQNNNVEIIREKISDNEFSQNIFFFIGDSYSGKTHTMFLLLHNIITNQRFSDILEYSKGKFAYCDINCSKDLHLFKSRYKAKQYNNHILIIDNIYKSTETNIFGLIDFLNSEILSAYAIIIILRKPEEFLGNTNQVNRLYHQIEKTGTRIDFKPLESEHKNNDFSEQLESVLKQYSLQKRDLTEFPFLYMQLLFGENNKNKEYIKKIFYDISIASQTDIVKMICVITISCLFNETFDKKTLIKYLRDIGLSKRSISRNLKIIINTNLISIDYLSSSYNLIYMHEKIALFFFKKTYINNKFLYKDLSNKLYNFYSNKNDLLTWAYSLLVREEIPIYNYRIFDSILLNSNQKTILNLVTNINSSINENNDSILRELSILKKLSGNHSDCVELLLKYYNNTHDLRAAIDLIEVKHSYLSTFQEQLSNYEAKDSYIYQSYQYWKIHIQMHSGVFSFDEMCLKLSCSPNPLFTAIKEEPFEGVYFAKRWYLDFFKLFYISGEMDCSVLLKFNEELKEIYKMLSTRLSYFYETTMIYCNADYIHYVMLFRISFLKEYPTYDEMAILDSNISNEIRYSFDELYKIAAEYYQKGNKALDCMGERSAWAAKDREVDLLLIKAENISDFIRLDETIERHLQYSFEMNRPEFIALVYTYKLKISLIKSLLFKDTEENKTVSYCICCARQNYLKKDDSVENSYGLLRLELYNILYLYQLDKNTDNLKHNILELSEKLQKNFYNRELVIIKYIQEKCYNLDESSLLNIYRNYPVLVQ